MLIPDSQPTSVVRRELSGSYVFTSESVTEGHPDKVCDQISDAVLDAILEKEIELASQGYVAPSGQPADPSQARVACETLVTTGLVVIAGEIRSQAYVEIENLVRQVIRDTGYNNPELGFDAVSCGVINAIHEQSRDIAMGVDASIETRVSDGLTASANYSLEESIGAGDQGMMFGYASNETATLMPMPIFLAHRLSERLAQVRKDDTLSYLRPDGKVQVSVRYKDDKPVGIEKILISTQHADGISIGSQLCPDLHKQVIAPVFDEWDIDWRDAEIIINPSGRFVIGGPAGDTGITGRKIIVDTYGGRGRHGGGSFSGKDATKVDRSAAYAARWVAKNLVAAGLAERCELQIAYAIGMAEPFSIMVDSFGTAEVPDSVLTEAVKQVFDLRPGAIINTLKLQRPIFKKTANYGHFGRELPEFTWENRDRVDQLRSAANRLS
ncbi:MAG: methionine adenosyltransferase [Coriobacteriales bacterium]|jgi:S-adenosylmethionine synthetase|nr:methionine adenosyltransferase [Coriobacteriales bacterium]